MDRQKLHTGVAYHGNRMPSHAAEDLKKIAAAGMDTVVHMFSHTDWDRNTDACADIFKMSADLGLDVWVDNWGLGGPPGDISRFTAAYPDAHMYLSNGEMMPYTACLNSPDFRAFIRSWVDKVVSMGAKTIFWDEPHLPSKGEGTGLVYGCTCKRCKKLFSEKYGYEMPVLMNDDAQEFRTDTIVDFLREVTDYSAAAGIYNTVCVMLGEGIGINLDTIDRICSLPNLHNIGSDPYWIGTGVDPYKYVYEGTRKNLEISERFGKDHNIWIQTYANKRGTEEEIVLATEAAYDAGARTILTWSYMAGESNNYRSDDPAKVWNITVEAMRRIRDMERDRILEEKRKLYRK